MKCWKLECPSEPIFFCPCSEIGTNSCEVHLIEHLRFKAQKVHQPEAIYYKSCPETKQALYSFLKARNEDLDKLKLIIINEITKRIKELNSHLIIALEEIKRVENKNLEYMRRIISTENTSKTNKIENFLTWEPNTALRSIKSCLLRIDKTKIPNYINFDFDNFKDPYDEIAIFRDNTKNLLRINLNDFGYEETELAIDKNMSMHLSICKLPDSRLFCFGGCNPYSSSAFMIYPDNSIKYLASRSVPCGFSSAIYYNGEVYAFGGQNANGYVMTPEKYNISQDQWSSLPKLSTGANYCTGFAYDNEIYFAGSEHKEIYIYRNYHDPYSRQISNLIPNSQKVLLLFNHSSYLIIEGNFKMREFKDIKNLNPTITDWNFNWIGTLASQVVQFNGDAYFIDSNFYLYKFDLAKKVIQQLRKI
ncbi:unnamed protein product [Blepharisma stoltei]|uniref:Uncharacterized protein n=1 Tax=Blepharisma stoltei TaxID=1481888 RepID=A0AAU9IIL9_9CILI|nr:unnamed protein product [Blepharisma stoltei]